VKKAEIVKAKAEDKDIESMSESEDEEEPAAAAVKFATKASTKSTKPVAKKAAESS